MTSPCLKFSVDIMMENPILIGFFPDEANGDDIWIQFKYEQLANFTNSGV